MVCGVSKLTTTATIINTNQTFVYDDAVAIEQIGKQISTLQRFPIPESKKSTHPQAHTHLFTYTSMRQK